MEELSFSEGLVEVDNAGQYRARNEEVPKAPARVWKHQEESLNHDDVVELYQQLPSTSVTGRNKAKIAKTIKSYLLTRSNDLEKDSEVITMVINQFRTIDDLDYDAYLLLIERIGMIAEEMLTAITEEMIDFVVEGLQAEKWKGNDYIRILTPAVKIAINLPNRVLAKRITSVAESFFHENFNDEFIEPLSLMSLILFRRPELLDDPQFIGEKLKTSLKLIRIGLREEGSADTNYGGYIGGVLSVAPAVKLDSLDGDYPERQKMQQDSVREVADIDSFLSQKEYTLIKVLGRRAIYRTQQGTYVSLKFLNEEEKDNLGILKYESDQLRYLDQIRDSVVLPDDYPRPSNIVEGENIAKFRTLPQGVEQLLEEQEERLRLSRGSKAAGQREINLDHSNGFYTVMADEAPSLDYFTYLSDDTLSDPVFETALADNLRILFRLARAGIIHTATINLFHSESIIGPERVDRPDLGRYIVLLDFIRNWKGAWYQGEHPIGNGGVYAWNNMSYLNLGVAGPRDWAEGDLLVRLMEPDHPLSKHLTHYLGQRFGKRTITAYLANYLGEYLKGLSLVEINRFREKDQLQWDDEESLDRIENALRDNIFNKAYREFTGREISEYIVDSIDWKMMARQFALYGSKKADYVVPINEKRMPPGIYRDDVKVELSALRLTEKVPEGGWSRDGVHADFGDYQGVNPVDEFVKALHIYSVAMATGKDSALIADIEQVDAAAVSSVRQIEIQSQRKKGGIDFNPNNLNIQSQGHSITFDLPHDPAMLNMNIDGLYPVIINITPITNIQALIGLVDEDDSDDISLHQDLSPADRKSRTDFGDPQQVSLLN